LIVAAFLGGSYARDAAGEGSDVDVYVIAREQDYAALWARRRELLAAWGEVAYAEDRRNFEGLGFDMLLFELADGVDGEIAFAHTGNFMAMHGGPHRVLVDRVGLLDGVEFPLL
jgi:predicted nucleotidyltransferase